ncbi:MAG: hypothetical protein R3D81_02970 [Thalassovita sp.]
MATKPLSPLAANWAQLTSLWPMQTTTALKSGPSKVAQTLAQQPTSTAWFRRKICRRTYGLGVSHDLGGASIEAGVTQNDILDRTLVSAGFFFAF